jgi:hypothetical protein
MGNGNYDKLLDAAGKLYRLSRSSNGDSGITPESSTGRTFPIIEENKKRTSYRRLI